MIDYVVVLNLQITDLSTLLLEDLVGVRSCDEPLALCWASLVVGQRKPTFLNK